MASYPDIELYIDGHWKRADGQPVINPADEAVLGIVPTATIDDLNDAIGAAERGFKRSVKLPVSAPFHCSLMQPAADAMATALANIAMKAPVVPVIANVTAEAVSGADYGLRASRDHGSMTGGLARRN